jgi:esterase/lipase
MTEPRPNSLQGGANAHITWFPAKQVTRPKGLALVIHGLNLKPSKMSPIINALTGAGIEVLNLSLRGHGENYAPRLDMSCARARAESLLEAAYGLWSKEARAAYRAMEAKCARLGVPTFFAGFSLGALLGVDLWAANADIRFDRALLFAPALDLRAPYRLVRILYPFPGLVIPSLSRREYLANRGVPIVAYRALLETIRHFQGHIGARVDRPTLIFIDRSDEFVSFKKLKGIIAANRLSKWKICFVEKDDDAKVRLKHMIIDEASLGRRMWRKMMAVGIKHFLGPL